MQPGKEFLHLKRFGKVIIRAGIDPLNPIRPFPVCSQNNNGHFAPVGAPLAEHRCSVNAGQTDIKDHSIKFFAVANQLCSLTVRTGFGYESGQFQVLMQGYRPSFYVLDDENKHRLHSHMLAPIDLIATAWLVAEMLISIIPPVLVSKWDSRQHWSRLERPGRRQKANTIPVDRVDKNVGSTPNWCRSILTSAAA